MKFNNEIMRDVLIVTEEKFGDPKRNPKQTDKPVMYMSIIHDDKLSKYDEPDVTYVVEQMIAGGFFDLMRKPQYDNDGKLVVAVLKGLSFKGQEFLKNIRDDKIWTTVIKKAAILEDVSMEVLCEVAKKLCEEAILNQEV